MKPPLKSAFVLAAGRGERLRPYTDQIPKPLLEVKGRPLLDSVLESLETLKLERVVLNAWHLKEQVLAYAKSRAKKFSFEILVSEEDELLGTGGGLKKAWPFLKGAPFLMANGDCLFQGEISNFVSAALSSEAEGTWWLAPVQADQTKIGVSQNKIQKIGSLWTSSIPSQADYCFSGIQVFREIHPSELPSHGSIVEHYWVPRLQKGASLGGESNFLNSWVDIGTPSRYESIR